jgi:hypothetical protein
MEMAGWSDEAVAGAASLAGSVDAAERMGLPPAQAAGLRAAALVEQGKRAKRGKSVSPRRSARGYQSPGPAAILVDLMRDPLTLGAISVLVSAIRMVGRPRPLPVIRTPVSRPLTPPRPLIPHHLPEPDFPIAGAYEDRADYVSAVAAWVSDPAVRARTRAEGIHSYGADLWDEVGGKLDADDERRSWAMSVQVAAVVAYSRWQVGGVGGYLAPAACYSLDRTVIAFCNMSTPDHTHSALRALEGAKGSDARRMQIAKIATEGREILKLHPGAWWLVPGAPRGKWPIPAPPEIRDDTKADVGAVAGAGIKPPGG